MSDLLELAERCEKAVGPDPVLDHAIWRWVMLPDHPRWFLGSMGECEEIWLFGDPKSDEDWDKLSPDFTASLDAAKSLIEGPPEYPHSKTYLIDCATQTSTHASPMAYVWNNAGKHTGKGRTDVLALCAAALRARALAQKDTNDA